MFARFLAKSELAEVFGHTLVAMLNERDTKVLDFEASWWTYPGSKDIAIRDYLGMSATRYYQVLRRLMDDPGAMERDPLTVRRLQRVRQIAAARRLERLGGSNT